MPYLVEKSNVVFKWLFGFTSPELITFPITSLGSVGAALGLISHFIEEGIINGNAIAVFTAIGICWSSYLSTYIYMFDSLKLLSLTSRVILASTIDDFIASISAHWIYMLVGLIS